MDLWAGFIAEALQGNLQQQQAAGNLRISELSTDLERLATESAFDLDCAELTQSELEQRLAICQANESRLLQISSEWISELNDKMTAAVSTIKSTESRLSAEAEAVHESYRQQMAEVHALEEMNIAAQRTLHDVMLHESEDRALIGNEQFDTAALLWSQVADRTTDRGTLRIIEEEMVARHVLMQSQWTLWAGFIAEALQGSLEQEQAAGNLMISELSTGSDSGAPSADVGEHSPASWGVAGHGGGQPNENEQT